MVTTEKCNQEKISKMVSMSKRIRKDSSKRPNSETDGKTIDVVTKEIQNKSSIIYILVNCSIL